MSVLDPNSVYIQEGTAAVVGAEIPVQQSQTLVFSQEGLAGAEEVVIEERLGGESGTWRTLTDKNGDDVKLTATILKVHVIAPGLYRGNKTASAGNTTVYTSR